MEAFISSSICMTFEWRSLHMEILPDALQKVSLGLLVKSVRGKSNGSSHSESQLLEMAFSLFLDKALSAIDNSDPAQALLRLIMSPSDDDQCPPALLILAISRIRTSYHEKIWDHPAGVILVQAVESIVTDARCGLLDFSKKETKRNALEMDQRKILIRTPPLSPAEKPN
uniref:Uncharacterized protein n=1 Tax=Cucumis melo TaxID=3656 RepID=A0A9I9E9G3_CUCME